MIGANAYYVSSPAAVAGQLAAWIGQGSIWGYLLSTLSDTLTGFLLAAAVAIPFALLLSSNRFLARVFQPFVFVLVSTPKVIVAPLLILWVGTGNPPVIALSFVSAFFLIFLNVESGLSSVPQAYITTATILGADRWTTAFKFRLPAAAPFIATGLHQGLIYAFHGAVLGEMTASNNGLGYLIVYSATAADSTAVIAGLATIGFISYVLISLLKLGFNRSIAPASEMESVA